MMFKDGAIIIEDEADGLAPHLALGRRGERLAAEFLESRGYRLVAANFQLPVGRSLRGALRTGMGSRPGRQRLRGL